MCTAVSVQEQLHDRRVSCKCAIPCTMPSLQGAAACTSAPSTAGCLHLAQAVLLMLTCLPPCTPVGCTLLQTLVWSRQYPFRARVQAVWQRN